MLKPLKCDPPRLSSLGYIWGSAIIYVETSTRASPPISLVRSIQRCEIEGLGWTESIDRRRESVGCDTFFETTQPNRACKRNRRERNRAALPPPMAMPGVMEQHALGQGRHGAWAKIESNRSWFCGGRGVDQWKVKGSRSLKPLAGSILDSTAFSND